MKETENANYIRFERDIRKNDIDKTNPCNIELQQADLEMKLLNIAEKRLNIENLENRRIKMEEDKILIEKIDTLKGLLTSSTFVDDYFIEDSKKNPIFSEDESWIVKDKLFRLLEKL